MPTISAIEPGRRKGRHNVYVDGAFAVAVGERVLVELMLRVGQPFDPERLREIAGAEEARKALESAMRLLELRARSSKEIEQRLREKGYEDTVIVGALATLTRLGLIDDADFAQQWVESRTRTRPKGARLLRSELAQKGVGKSEIEEAVAQVTPESEAEMARRALAPKLGKRALPQGKLERRAEYQRLASFLQRRGFGWDAIKAALGEAFAAEGSTGESEDGDEEPAMVDRLGADNGDGSTGIEPRLGGMDGAFGADEDRYGYVASGIGLRSQKARFGRRGDDDAGDGAAESYERRLGGLDGDASVKRKPLRGAFQRPEEDTGD